MANCPTCYTSSNDWRKGVIECAKCHGEGYKSDLLSGRSKCATCDGKGAVKCPNCSGTGKV